MIKVNNVITFLQTLNDFYGRYGKQEKVERGYHDVDAFLKIFNEMRENSRISEDELDIIHDVVALTPPWEIKRMQKSVKRLIRLFTSLGRDNKDFLTGRYEKRFLDVQLSSKDIIVQVPILKYPEIPFCEALYQIVDETYFNLCKMYNINPEEPEKLEEEINAEITALNETDLYYFNMKLVNLLGGYEGYSFDDLYEIGRSFLGYLYEKIKWVGISLYPNWSETMEDYIFQLKRIVKRRFGEEYIYDTSSPIGGMDFEEAYSCVVEALFGTEYAPHIYPRINREGVVLIDLPYKNLPYKLVARPLSNKITFTRYRRFFDYYEKIGDIIYTMDEINLASELPKIINNLSSISPKIAKTVYEGTFNALQKYISKYGVDAALERHKNLIKDLLKLYCEDSEKDALLRSVIFLKNFASTSRKRRVTT